MKITQIAAILEMDENTVLKRIVDWAKQFGFKIRGDEVIFSQGNTSAFIDELDKQFSDWDVKTKQQDGKI